MAQGLGEFCRKWRGWWRGAYQVSEADNREARTAEFRRDTGNSQGGSSVEISKNSVDNDLNWKKTRDGGTVGAAMADF